MNKKLYHLIHKTTLCQYPFIMTDNIQRLSDRVSYILLQKGTIKFTIDINLHVSDLNVQVIL